MFIITVNYKKYFMKNNVENIKIKNESKWWDEQENELNWRVNKWDKQSHQRTS